MAHSEQFFAEILSAESFVDTHALAAAALHGVPRAVRAETWKYLLSVCKPDRSQELSAEREQLKDYLRHDKHNAEVVQRVRAELRRYSSTAAASRGGLSAAPASASASPRAHSAGRRAQLANADNWKSIENVVAAFLHSNPSVVYDHGLVHMLCPFMGCGLSDEADLFHCYESLLRRLQSKFAAAGRGGLAVYASKFIALLRELLPEVCARHHSSTASAQLLPLPLPCPHTHARMAYVRRWYQARVTLRVCTQLHWKLELQEVCCSEWCVPWLRFLLSRELTLANAVRLWDTYIALDADKTDASIETMLDFHLYTCIAILEPCQEQLVRMQRSDIQAFLQELPEMDIDEVITKASCLQKEVKIKQLF
jgi:hypothetical protein